MADTALHSMTIGTPSTDDEMYLLKDPASTPLDRRMKVQNIFYAIDGLVAPVSPAIDNTTNYLPLWDGSAPYKRLSKLVGSYEVAVQGITSTNPADATTYYFGAFAYGWQTTIGNTKVRVHRTGYLLSASLFIIAGGTGSAETSTVSFRLNDTTDTTISSAVDLSASPFEAVNVAMNVAVTAGDWFTVKWVTPTWVTNPSNVSFACRLFFT